MPEHVHGILHIGDNDCIDHNKMALSKIIHGYKSTVSPIIHRDCKNDAFQWQRSFHDHIIRNEEELHNIRDYIRANIIEHKRIDEGTARRAPANRSST